MIPGPATGQPVPVVAIATRDSGIYHIGEPITFRIDVKAERADPVVEAQYTAKLHVYTLIASGKLDLVTRTASFTTKVSEPGGLLVKVFGTTKSGKPFSTYAGAVVSPDAIRWPGNMPDDFDRFWDSKLAESAALPLNPKEEKNDRLSTSAIDYFKVTLDNINKTHVYGQLARPKARGKYPAIMLVQYAGVYDLKPESVTGWARDGWLALNISAHDLPIDLPETEINSLVQGSLKDYTVIGQTDRETSYFLRMFLGCTRAVDYLSLRDDWNGKVLIVRGGSQGGLQSIVSAALNPKVTAIMALCPAGCGNTGAFVKRGWGWPYWQAHARTDNTEADKIMNTSKYFDAIYFAHRVKCPSLIGVGLMETSCPVSNVVSMCNALSGPVEILILPEAGHQSHDPNKLGEAPFNRRSTAWSADLKLGLPAPVQKLRDVEEAR